VKKTTSQNHWPQINSLIIELDFARFQKPRKALFFLAASATKFGQRDIARRREYFQDFLAIFWLVNSLQKEAF